MSTTWYLSTTPAPFWNLNTKYKTEGLNLRLFGSCYAIKQLLPNRLLALHLRRRSRCTHSPVDDVLRGSKTDVIGGRMDGHVTDRHSCDRRTVFEEVTCKR